MEPTAGTAVLCIYAAFLFATTRPKDRLAYSSGAAGIFLVLALAWQREHDWIGILNIPFGIFTTVHAVAFIVGMLIGWGAYIGLHDGLSSK